MRPCKFRGFPSALPLEVALGRSDGENPASRGSVFSVGVKAAVFPQTREPTPESGGNLGPGGQGTFGGWWSFPEAEPLSLPGDRPQWHGSRAG